MRSESSPILWTQKQPSFLSLLDDPTFRSDVVRISARMNHPNTASALLKRFKTFSEWDKKSTISALSGRESMANKLLDEIIVARKAKAIEYEEYLKRIAELAKRVESGQADDMPEKLDTPG